MEFDKIKELIEAVSKSNLTRFEMEEGNLEISMRTDKDGKNVILTSPESAVAVPAVPAAAAQSAPAVKEEPASGNVVKSPLVGTFYCAPSEGADPYVKVGDVVKKGQVLGIVEAMKLMNEIESEFDGEVVEILVENEQMVEYGQPLFVIR